MFLWFDDLGDKGERCEVVKPSSYLLTSGHRSKVPQPSRIIEKTSLPVTRLKEVVPSLLGLLVFDPLFFSV